MAIQGARVQINQQAIRSNLAHISGSLTGTEVCIVVKADAYGHGIDLVLPLVIEQGFTTVGIASNEEAQRVRALGFEGRLIRVRAAAPKEISAARIWNVEEWVGGFLHARAVAEIAISLKTTIPVHIALNSTGLSRESLDLVSATQTGEFNALLQLKGLDIRGICSHFPMEDAADTRRGAAVFAREASQVLHDLGPQRATGLQLHCASSFAAFSVPESRFDLVRIGAAVYGDTSARVDWQRSAMRLVAPITSVNLYPAGNTVGYGRELTLTEDSVIATVPTGYGDGIPRSVGGHGIALVRGKAVPIIDRLAMNTLSLDVTQVPGVLPGDEAVFYGAQGGRTISSEIFETHAHMIAAAAYTSWGRVLPREVSQETVPLTM